VVLPVEAIVAVVSGIPILASAAASFRKYLAARGKKNVKITIDGQDLELGNVTEKQAEQIISAWLSRYANNPKNLDAE
jgi:hypothetical protein